MGWGFCAFEAAHGGWYPAPGYDYYLGSAPDGIDTSDLKAMGWAMSEAQRLGWWTSGNGATFDADDIAVAGKLLYDNVAWGRRSPRRRANSVRPSPPCANSLQRDSPLRRRRIST